MKESKKGVAHFFAAFRYTLAGLGAALRHEAAFRQDVAFAAVNIALAWIFAPAWFAALQTALSAVLLSMELLNSAIETVVDLASPGWHELAKRAKDMGSAAVGIIIAAIVSLWISRFF